MHAEAPQRIEDYAMIGDGRSAALVGRNGSIDWLCLPRFDSPACFAALLGDSDNGRWLIAPAAHGGAAHVARSYRGQTMVLETVFTTVEGRSGHVAMQLDLALRFDYGITVPWVTRLDDHTGLCAIAGPAMVVLRAPVKLRGEEMRTAGHFTVHAGERLPFVLSHRPSHMALPPPLDAASALEAATRYWEDFIGRCSYTGPYSAAVRRSLITLKALSYQPTGGIVAAVTTSLPEFIGGDRNWDYRYCWLRDASLTLFALMGAGYTEEAVQWRDWLQRSVAGSAAQIQIMYGLYGERSLDEREIPWPATRTAGRCGWATRPAPRCSLMCMARCWNACTRRACTACTRHRMAGPCSAISWNTWPRSGNSRTMACGRSAAAHATSPSARSWPGWRWTAR
jgi:glucoamylase